jgi:predicted RNA-binding protein associated with RNAse of E/G family
VFKGRRCYEYAARVLLADETSVTAARWPGSAIRDIPAYIESVKTGDAALREEARQARVRGDWELADFSWQRTGVIEETVSGRWFTVSRMYAATGVMLCWYVNFERPPLWRPDGWDTLDLAIDLVVEPDRTWHWKDEDEYEQGRRLGLITDEEHKALRPARDEAVALIEARGGMFAVDADERWTPDPSWPLPKLPAAALSE